MGGLQDMAHVDLMKPITKWSVSGPHARRLGEYVQAAFRVATTNVPGPGLPRDAARPPLRQRRGERGRRLRQLPHRGGRRARIRASSRRRSSCCAARSARCASSEASSSGRGGARPIPEFVRTFGMPVYVNGQARGSLDPDDPHWFLQTRKDALKRADVVMIFGTPLDFRIGYGRSSHINEARSLIHVDPRRPRAREEPRRRRPASSATRGSSWRRSPPARERALEARAVRAPGSGELRALEKDKWVEARARSSRRTTSR
jgi:acetolactate synthase-1/2/3 large subunit